MLRSILFTHFPPSTPSENYKRFSLGIDLPINSYLAMFCGMEWNQELSKDELKKWGEVMLQHSFDQEEWLEARVALLKLLVLDQKVATESAIRSYISCCAEAVGATPPLPSLKESVIELYQQYGMEESGKN